MPKKFTTFLVFPIIFASALTATFLVFAAVAPSDLLGHWALNDGSGVIASDASGNGNNGALTNGPNWNSNELLFDGNNDYVNIGTLDLSGSTLTLASWAQSDNLGNCSFRDCRIVSKATGISEQDHYWMIGTIKVGTTTRLRFRLKAGGVTSTLIASSGNINNGDVFHVAAVYDGTTMRLYKDGIKVGSLPKTGVIDTNPAVEVWIGGNPTVASSRPWDGSLADVRVYQTALTAAEIQTVKDSYNIENLAPSVDAGIDQTVILADGASQDVTLDATVSDDGLPGSLTTLWTAISGPEVILSDSRLIDTTVNFSRTGVYVLSLSADDGEFTSNDQINITVRAAVESGEQLGHWELNDGSGIIASDASGNNNDGTLINGPTWNGNELLFDGNNDYVNLETLDISGSALTLAGWAQSDNLGNCSFRDCRLVSKATGVSEQDHYWMIGTIKVGTTTRLRFRLKAGGVTSTLVASSGNINNGDVFHVAATYDGTRMRLYKDGVEVGSLAKTGAIDTNTAVKSWIGGNPPIANSRPWEGSIADVRLYRTALTSAEVNTIKDSYDVGNVAPTVDAGVDQIIALPSLATLDATISDDGLPNSPASVTTLWTVVSGSGTVTFTNDTSVDTTASFSLAGNYVLNLAANDGDLTTNDQITITVDATGSDNVAPTVDAGFDQTITLSNDAKLNATVSDDGFPALPGSVTTLWTFISGPGSVTFANTSLVDTTASFSLAGVYVLDLVADDGDLTTNDQLTITVNTAGGSGDLLGHWALNDGSGAIASDSSGNGNNGTLANNPIWNGNELLFDGSNDYVNLGTLDVPGNALTLTSWVKSDNLENCTFFDCRILSKATGVSEQDHLWMIGTIKVGTTTRLRFRLKADGITSTLVASSGDINNGDVFHVAATYDGTDMRLYKDGAEVGSLAKTGAIYTNTGVEAWIGGNPPVASSRPWKGALANVRVYQKSLTPAEVIAIMNTDEQADTTAPIISNRQVIITGSSATISWDTNEAADSNVSYGTSNAYESGTVSNGASVISHSLTLSGLTENTTFHYQLTSTDGSGNTVTSANFNFITETSGDELVPELLMFDWNTIITKANHGFPRDLPPMNSANGNWLTPINYANGTLYLRAQINPGGQPIAQTMIFNYCIWQRNPATENKFGLEECVHFSPPLVGNVDNEITWSEKISSMALVSEGPIDWTRARHSYGVAIKNTDLNPVSDYKSWNWFGEDPDDWYPLYMRFTVVVVPNGQTFSGWDNY